ncbi:MAG: hypothetical protein LQ351_007065 [Letrouitia transgressa]|nr:MAG: hypothetical protein LQ351_007065 [Letrouitia transgressa]
MLGGHIIKTTHDILLMTLASDLAPLVCVVGFHHARGPEIERWFGVDNGNDPATDNDWALLPFMALSDGSHTSTEDFSYFTLRATSTSPATSMFGISCTRQMDATHLLDRPADVTRSTVQKAVVVIAYSPQLFGHIREKLSMVTGAWFAQRDFTDVDILKKFQESLSRNLRDAEGDKDLYLGLSLRELVYEYKHQTLVLFKCCLLQPKMLFFGSRCERLCMMQFSLISLIPGLLEHLEDCADPEFDSYEQSLIKPSSLRTSERSSLLSFMGLPLQLFGKGSLFGPYTPLQQLDVLADYGTRSYLVGSTNSLLLQQKDRYSDILINLDETSVTVTSPSLRKALSLSHADRRWIDLLLHHVTSNWNPLNPSRPTTLGYIGSEEFIRLQFEEYLLSLLSCTKYHLYLRSNPASPPPISEIEGDPSLDFGADWIAAWKQTNNFRLFDAIADSHLFNIVEPRHPTAGSLSIDDVQRRLAQQIQTLHLDDRFANTKESLNKQFASGQKKVSTAFSKVWNDIEAFRETQRRKAIESSAMQENEQPESGLPALSLSKSEPHAPAAPTIKSKSSSPSLARFASTRAPDLTSMQASMSAAGQRAGVYMSSWGAWAAEKKKGWSRRSEGEDEDAKGREKGAGERISPKKVKEETRGDGIGRLDA